MIDIKLARFLMVGAGNTLIGLLVIYAFKLAGVGDVLANALGYGVGIVIGFCLNRQWTFRHKETPWLPFARFLLITLLAYTCNLLVVMGSINGLHVNAFIAQGLGIPVYTLISYLGSRYYVFARPKSREA